MPAHYNIVESASIVGLAATPGVPISWPNGTTNSLWGPLHALHEPLQWHGSTKERSGLLLLLFSYRLAWEVHCMLQRVEIAVEIVIPKVSRVRSATSPRVLVKNWRRWIMLTVPLFRCSAGCRGWQCWCELSSLFAHEREGLNWVKWPHRVQV